MRKSLTKFLSLLVLCTSFSLSATNPNDENKVKSIESMSIFDRLCEKEVLEISVKTNIEKLLANKKSSKYQGAYIRFTDADDDAAEWRVEIRARGKYRNRICAFPPLKVKFDHSVLGPEHLKAFKSLKLVTHCGDQAETEETLLKEYLAYKIYNTITDQSLRVQLVKINWIDSHGKHQIGEKWGFLIENKDEMAQRLGGGVYKEYGVQHDDINSQSAAQNSLFQYMIGNADWSLEKNKNIKLIKSNTTQDIAIIPYDFDFSGLVDATYARPESGLISVKERVYLGASTSEDIKEALELFELKKKDIIDLVSSFNYLSRSGRNDVKKYIRSFYSSIDEPMKNPEYYRERIASKDVAHVQRVGK